MHSGHRMQHRLDLGRIDVDAAGDHHVALAVADEDVAVLVDVTDIPRGDETVAVDLGTFLRLVVIGEVRRPGHARIDLADLAGREHAAVVTDEAQLRTGRDPADRARLLQRILGGRKGHGAGFGRAVEFVDHRPPPLDHGTLDVGWTRRGGVDDVAKRGDVVPLRTSSSSFIRRMNMVGTMKMVSILYRSISWRNSSASKRGISTSAPPSFPARRPNEFGAE